MARRCAACGEAKQESSDSFSTSFLRAVISACPRVGVTVPYRSQLRKGIHAKCRSCTSALHPQGQAAVAAAAETVQRKQLEDQMLVEVRSEAIKSKKLAVGSRVTVVGQSESDGDAVVQSIGSDN
eukprot:5735210-Prymnesium_polylepis.1